MMMIRRLTQGFRTLLGKHNTEEAKRELQQDERKATSYMGFRSVRRRPYLRSILRKKEGGRFKRWGRYLKHIRRGIRDHCYYESRRH